MARPTETPEWATGASRRLEPTEPQKDDGFNEGTRTPARFANWIVGLVSDWSAYVAEIFDADDEHQYPAPKARVRVLGASAGVFDSNWQPTVVGNGIVLESQAVDAEWLLSLGWLPEGASVTRLRAWVDPGAARGVVGDRMNLEVISHLFEDPTSGGSGAGTSFVAESKLLDIVDDGTSDLQVIDSGVLGTPIAIGKQWFVGGTGTQVRDRFIRLLSGGTAGTDRLHLIEIYYDDPGLQNL